MGVQDGQCSPLLPWVTQSFPEEDMAEPGLEKATEGAEQSGRKGVPGTENCRCKVVEVASGAVT